MDAEGARAAVREIFLRVKGPTHMYLEPLPAEWPAAATRRVLEAREELQKAAVRGPPPAEALPQLLRVVQRAEQGG
jgi:hypothetical protein